MKNRVREDISAYLDGEAKDSASIARLIAESEHASKEYNALAEMSARIRSLETPDVHPAFAARVCATIQEQNARRRFAWRIPAALATAAAVMLVAYVSINATAPVTLQTPVNTVAKTPDATPVVLKDEDTLLAEFDRRVAQDTGVQHFIMARFNHTGDTADIYSERLLYAVARSEGAAAAGAALAHGMDYRTSVQRLDGEQAAALKELLAASMQEALEG